MSTVCTRSASCRCDDCVAAMGMFSAKDLMAVSSSKVDFGDEGDAKPVQAPVLPPKPVAVVSSTTTGPTVAAPPAAPEPPAAESTEADEATESFEGLSLDELIAHSNWKARKLGYSQLEKVKFKVDDGYFEDYFNSSIKEGSVPALDQALDCCRVFIQHQYKGRDTGELCRTAIPALFKKALVGRPGTKNRAVELVLDMMQVDKTCMAVCLETLDLGFKEKNPKVGVGVLSCARAATNSFGGRKLPLAGLQKLLLSGLNAKSPLVKKEAVGLAVDIDQWFKGAFQDIIKACVENEAQRKTVLSAMEKATGGTEALTVSRRLRGESDAPETEENEETADLFDALPETQVLEKLHTIQFEKRLKEPKWQERKKVLAEFVRLCGDPPKLARGEYGDVVRPIRGLIQKDSNQAVVVQAIQVLGVLGSGLRSEFHMHARSCCSQLLYKYRDKKMPLINAVNRTLDVFAQHCMNLTEERMLGEIDDSISTSGDSGKLKSTPLQRLHIIEWINRCLTNGWCWSPARKKHLDLEGLTHVFEILSKSTTDADPKVREASIKGLSALYLDTTLEPEYAEIVKAHVEELIRVNPKLESKLKGVSKPDSSSKTTVETKAQVAVEKSKKPAAAAPMTKPTRKPAKQKPAEVASEEIDLTSNESIMEVDEAQELVKGVEGLDEALEKFNEATKWQDKLHVFNVLDTHVQGLSDLKADPMGNALLVYVSSKTKEFKEPNFNIMKAGWSLVNEIVAKSNSPPVSKGYALWLLEACLKKLGDKKQSQVVQDVALSLCEATNPKFVSAKVLQVCDKTNSPKTLEDALCLLTTITKDFGAASLNVKTVVEFAAGPKGLEARQAPTKKQALDLLSQLFHQIGPPVRQILGDKCKDQVEAAFDKIGYAGKGKAPVPTRKTKSAAPVSEDLDMLSDLVPRVDISSLLTDKLIDNLGDESSKAAWKVRMKAIDDIVDIVQGAKGRIQLNRAVKLTVAELRKRLNDSNRNLVTKAVIAIGLVGNGVGGDGVVSLSKGTISPLLNCLSDGKKTVVMATEKALEQWTVHDGETHQEAFFAILQQVAPALSEPKNDRKVVLQWMLKHFPTDKTLTDEEHETLSNLAKPLVICLQSKAPTERKLALQCVKLVVAALGREDGEHAFNTCLRDLKPAVARTLTPMLKSAYSEEPAEPAAHAATSTTTTQNRTMKPKTDKTKKKQRTNSSNSSKETSASNGVSAAAEGPCFKSVPPALRERREERGRRKRWPAHFDEKDKTRMREYHQTLKDDLEKVVSKELLSKMFIDADSGRAARGSALDPAFQTLMKELPNYGHEAMECFDLLLKWSTLQLSNNNSTVTGNVLQLLEMMFELASGANYAISDYEAAAFLPHLIGKLSEKQKRFRESVRGIMRLVCQCYPYSKYVPFIHNEVSPQQRSMYVLSECIDELARLVRVHGLVCLKVKVGVGQNVLKTVTSFVGDSKKEVRANALLFLEQVWEHDGRDQDILLDKHFKHFKVVASDKIVVLIKNHLTAAYNKDPEGGVEAVAPQPKLPSRSLRLQVASTTPAGKPPADSMQSPAVVPRSRIGKAPPSPSTPDYVESPVAHKSSTASKLVSKTKPNILFDVDLPATPPSPSDRKRIILSSNKHNEKENNPNTESITHAMFHTVSTTGTPAGPPPVKYVKIVSSIESNAKAYLGLLKEPSESTAVTMDVRHQGIKALALLGSRDPPPGWNDSPKEWIALLSNNIDATGVVNTLLDLLSEVTNSQELPLSTDLEIARKECRLLKLVLPGVFTLAWWPELRDNVSSGTCSRWVTVVTDLISRLMQQKTRQLNASILGSEEVHELQQEREKLLKTAQTVFAKLSESPSWLPAVLNRIRKSNELTRSFTRCGSPPPRVESERRLKSVLRSSLKEYVSLQESFVEPYQNASMVTSAHALNDLLTVGIVDGDPEAAEDKGIVDLLVRSMLKSGKKFTDAVPEKSALRVLVAQILVVKTDASVKKDEGLDDADKASLTGVFSRISEAINSSNKSMRDEAIAELFRFEDSHPGFDAKQYLGDSSPWFQKYILEELQKRRDSSKKEVLFSVVSTTAAAPTTKPLGESSSAATKNNIPSVNVASIRERIGKLRKDYVGKTVASNATTTEVQVGGAVTKQTTLTEEDPIHVATEQAKAAAAAVTANATTTLKTIRERMAARKALQQNN